MLRKSEHPITQVTISEHPQTQVTKRTIPPCILTPLRIIVEPTLSQVDFYASSFIKFPFNAIRNLDIFYLEFGPFYIKKDFQKSALIQIFHVYA